MIFICFFAENSDAGAQRGIGSTCVDISKCVPERS